MKRLPVIVIFVLFIALCMSAAYWGMQLFKPPVRPVVAPMQVSKADINLDAAASLFGGRAAAVAVASNFQLRGIVLAGRANESLAILAAEGKPGQAIMVDKEVAPGVVVKEVHAQYILLSEGGVTKRVELPDSAKGQTSLSAVNNSPVPAQTAQQARPSQQQPQPVQSAQPAQIIQPTSPPPTQPTMPVPASSGSNQVSPALQSPSSTGTPPSTAPNPGAPGPGTPGAR
jgi:general secretion pathway protein C